MKMPRPLGCGPGIFGHEGNRLLVLIAQPGDVGVLTFEYVDEMSAVTACAQLQHQLATTNKLARRLRRAYSVPNLMAFLSDQLPDNGFVALLRPVKLVLDNQSGLREERNGEFFAVDRNRLVEPVDELQWELIDTRFRRTSGNEADRARLDDHTCVMTWRAESMLRVSASPTNWLDSLAQPLAVA